VDDSATNRELVSRQLQRQGYQITTAVNGREALHHIEQTPCHLMLLDILMPEMNGYEVLMALRQRDARDRLPVIMMSSLDEIDNVVQCIELGAEDYIAKPFNPVLLDRKISACLERERLRQREVLFLAQSLIAETTPVPVLVTRQVDGHILYANPKASESFGLPTETLLTCRIQDFYHHPHDREELGHRLRQHGQVHGYELPCRRANGDLFWVTLSLQTLSFHGEPAALMALCDITDRKQAEEQLRQAEMKYRGIFENAVEGIYQADPQGRFLSVNQAMATLYGYATPEAMLQDLADHPHHPYVEPTAAIASASKSIRRIGFRALSIKFNGQTPVPDGYGKVYRPFAMIPASVFTTKALWKM
jgi:PAS domain S-box-containing protein